MVGRTMIFGLFGVLMRPGSDRDEGGAHHAHTQVSEHKKRRRTVRAAAGNNTTMCSDTVVTNPVGPSNCLSSQTARPGSIAADAAGSRLQRRETLCRQISRALRTTGEKPSVAGVVPSADAPTGTHRASPATPGLPAWSWRACRYEKLRRGTAY